MRGGKFLHFGFVIASVLYTGPVMAEGFGCAASLSPAGMVACLQARDVILTRELAVAGKEKALRKMGDLNSRHLSLPQVESTYGSPGRLEAVLYWSGGASLVVSRGDVIPGGYHIVGITPGRVSVTGRNGETHVLLMEGGSGGVAAEVRTGGETAPGRSPTLSSGSNPLPKRTLPVMPGADHE